VPDKTLDPDTKRIGYKAFQEGNNFWRLFFSAGLKQMTDFFYEILTSLA
jgi:hypothetical protein